MGHAGVGDGAVPPALHRPAQGLDDGQRPVQLLLAVRALHGQKKSARADEGQAQLAQHPQLGHRPGGSEVKPLPQPRLPAGLLRPAVDGGDALQPQGTAGQPMLNVFVKEEVTNAVCVVTRYFGGILLGAGGLTRAYGGTAKLALDAAGISRMRLWAVLAVPCAYSLYERMRLLVEKCGGVVENADFGTDVLLTVLLPAEDVDDFQEKVTELSAGTVEVLLEEERFQPGPV